MSWANEYILFVVVAASAVFLTMQLPYFLQSRQAAARLVRHLPTAAQGLNSQVHPGQSEGILRAALRRLDPTFASMERQLRAMGVDSINVILGMEFVKIALAALVCLGGAMALAAHFANPLVQWLGGGIMLSLVLFGSNSLLSSVSKSRRRRIIRELCFGVDLLTIFLESGQSLDQALRSFCDVSFRATPLLESAQRRLIADMDNGIPYEKALGAWAENLAVGHADTLASLFVQSLVHGSELAPQLRRFSVDLSERRVTTARESIGSKSARLTLVMVVFFLPAILTFIAVPPFISVIEHLGR